ncbi:hypothetical protein [Halobacterium salinarum]|uniref:hypothetical protein n=1 Tax=Halobacterium salinarum TaxID=2242 RepID=UPI0025534668|nr:hypothetical protein [Halobacterium salinarum]MDL0133480.1 hypothetical protein [Halobacterium salinarum]
MVIIPFTLFHFGPGLLFGLLLVKYIDFPTFVIANVIIDWRAALVVFGLWPGPRHSWMHTYLGAILFSMVLTIGMVLIRPELDKLMESINLHQRVSVTRIAIAAFLGSMIHVTIDAFHHPLMYPFMPYDIKPLYGLFSTREMRFFTAFCGFLAILWYIGDYFGLIHIPTK